MTFCPVHFFRSPWSYQTLSKLAYYCWNILCKHALLLYSFWQKIEKGHVSGDCKWVHTFTWKYYCWDAILRYGRPGMPGSEFHVLWAFEKWKLFWKVFFFCRVHSGTLFLAKRTWNLCWKCGKSRDNLSSQMHFSARINWLNLLCISQRIMVN